VTPSAELVKPAARLAAKLGHSIYDCLYLALAAAQSTAVAAADDRLRRAAERIGIPVWPARRP
jgi:predicted nucleic acid-binding protein